MYSTDYSNGDVQIRHTDFDLIPTDVDGDGFVDLALKYKEQYYNYYIWDDILKYLDPIEQLSDTEPPFWNYTDGRSTFLNYFKFFDKDKNFISDDKRTNQNYNLNLMNCQEEFAAYIPYEQDGSKGSEFLIFSKSKGTEVFDGYITQVSNKPWIPFRKASYLWLDFNNDGYNDVAYSDVAYTDKKDIYIKYNNGVKLEDPFVVIKDYGWFKKNPLGYDYTEYPIDEARHYSYPTGGYYPIGDDKMTFVSDFNGDGLIDFLNYEVRRNHNGKYSGSYNLYLNTGGEYFTSYLFTFEDIERENDLFLSGYMDKVSRFSGLPQNQFYDTFKDKIVINCQTVNVSANGAQIYNYNNNGSLISFNPNKRSTKLVRVTDSYRIQNVVKYAPAALQKLPDNEQQYYFKVQNTPLVYNDFIEIQAPGDLVVGLETYKNLNEELLAKSEYTYSSGIYDRKGMGFLGYKEHTASTFDHKGKSTIWSVSRINETFDLMTPCSLSVYRNNQLTYQTLYDITYKDLQNKRYTVQNSTINSKNFIDDTRIVEQMNYDDWGNCYNSISTIFDEKDNTKYLRNTSNIDFNNSISSVNWSNKTLAKEIYSRLENEKSEYRESLTSFDYYSDCKIASINYNKNRDTQQLAFFEYDKWGNINRKYNKWKVADNISEEFNVSSILFDEKGRNVNSFKDINENTYLFEYDDLYNDLVKVTMPGGDFISYLYNNLGLPYKATSSNGMEFFTELNWTDGQIRAGQKTLLKVTKTSTFGDELSVFIDYALNRISVDDKRFDINPSDIKEYKADNYYNWDGSLFKKTSQYKADAEPNDYSICEYDDFMRPLIHKSYKEGVEVSSTQMDFSSMISDRLIKVVDSDNNQKQFKYDYLGNPVYHIDNFSNKVSFENNILGQITKIKTPYLNQQEAYQIDYKYDWYGNLLEMNSPDDGKYEYYYDEKNINYKTKNPNGSIEQQFYEDGNLKNIIITDKNGLSKTAEFTYLEDFCGTKNLFLDEIRFDGITYKDILSENYKLPLVSTISLDNRTFTFNYQYDNNIPELQWGFLTRYTTPNASTEYEYNEKARLVRVNSEGNLLWQALKTNDYNSVIQFSRNNNSLLDNAVYDSYKMIVNYSSIANGNNIINMNFDMNHSNGVLNYKTEQIGSKQLKETYLFDELYRLTDITTFENNVQTSGPNVVDYYKDGSIKNKYDVGEYEYPTNVVPGPAHVPQSVQANQMLPEFVPQKITYTAFNSVETIETGNYKTKYYYGIDYQRIKSELYENDILKKTKYYFPNYELTDYHNGITKEITYINDDGGAFAAKVKIDDNGEISENLYYLHYDHLGSLIAVTDEQNNTVGRMSFDSWGRMRNPENWTNIIADENTNNIYQIFERGYGFHEHMPEHNLINMNGRIYDPLLGQFIQPDSYIQFPDYSQSYNSYSYVLNNPVQYRDPSGEYVLFILAGMMNVYESIHQYNLGNGARGAYLLRSSVLCFAGAMSDAGGGGGDESNSINYDDTPLEPGLTRMTPGFLESSATYLLLNNKTDFIGYFSDGKNIGRNFYTREIPVYASKTQYNTFLIKDFVMPNNPILKAPLFQPLPNIRPNQLQGIINYDTKDRLFDDYIKPGLEWMPVWGNCQIATDYIKDGNYLMAALHIGLAFGDCTIIGNVASLSMKSGMLLARASSRTFAKQVVTSKITNKIINAIEKFGVEAGENLPKIVNETAEVTPKLISSSADDVCFIGGTEVFTVDGIKPIESVEIGQFVMSYERDENKQQKCQVLNISKRKVSDFRKIYFANDSIICTLEHPFFVNNVWVESKTLRAGDSLLSYDGKKIAIDSVSFYISDTSEYVYNLEVEGLRNYYVSATKVLVHNCESTIELARRLGKEGEAAVGIEMPKKGIKINDVNYFPDFVDQEVLIEVKNVKQLYFTKQLNRYFNYSQEHSLIMMLYIRRNTKISKTLEHMINKGKIIIKYIPE